MIIVLSDLRRDRVGVESDAGIALRIGDEFRGLQIIR